MDVAITIKRPPMAGVTLQPGQSLRLGRNPTNGPQIVVRALPEHSKYLSAIALELHNDGTELHVVPRQGKRSGDVIVQWRSGGRAREDRFPPPFDLIIRIKLTGEDDVLLTAIGRGRPASRDRTATRPLRSHESGLAEPVIFANAIECAIRISAPKSPTNELVRRILLLRGWRNTNGYAQRRGRARQAYGADGLLDILKSARDAGAIHADIVEELKLAYLAAEKDGVFDATA